MGQNPGRAPSPGPTTDGGPTLDVEWFLCQALPAVDKVSPDVDCAYIYKYQLELGTALVNTSLQELRKQTENPDLQADISRAIDSIQCVLDAANNAIDKEHLATAVVDLAERVDDWKSLKVDSFGELLRFGTFAVVKGDTGKDSEREVSPSTPPPASDPIYVGG